MSGTVILNPGQDLRIVLGKSTSKDGVVMTTCADFSYDKLTELLLKKSGAKSKSSPASKASRTVFLTARAAITGKWTTGAPVDKTLMTVKLVSYLNELPADVKSKLSEKAIEEALTLAETLTAGTLRDDILAAFPNG